MIKQYNEEDHHEDREVIMKRYTSMNVKVKKLIPGVLVVESVWYYGR